MNAMTASRTTIISGARRAILAGLLALLAVSALSLIGARPASAATVRQWKGAGADGNWTNPANWIGGAPVPGDQLVFGETAARLTNVNNFPVDTAFDSIILQGTGYNLTGNRVRLTDGLFSYNDTLALANTVTLAIKVPELLYFKADAPDHSVTYKGGLVLNADATFEGLGNQIVTGPVTGTGAIIATAGRLTLAGTSASTGATKIAGGLVFVTGSYPGRPVSIENSTLSGSGTTGPVNVSSGEVAPALPTTPFKPAALNVTGNLTLSSTSQYSLLVNGSGPGSYSQLVVSGRVRLGNAKLGVFATRTSPFVVGQVLTIVKNNGTTAVSGTFSNFPEGWVVFDKYDPYITYRISYKGGATGRDVTLTVLTLTAV